MKKCVFSSTEKLNLFMKWACVYCVQWRASCGFIDLFFWGSSKLAMVIFRSIHSLMFVIRVLVCWIVVWYEDCCVVYSSLIQSMYVYYGIFKCSGMAINSSSSSSKSKYRCAFGTCCMYSSFVNLCSPKTSLDGEFSFSLCFFLILCGFWWLECYCSWVCYLVIYLSFLTFLHV